MGGARAAVAAASVALLLHYTRLAHGVTLREVGVLDAGADLEGFSLEPQDAIPPVTSLKLAWNGAEPPVVTHYAPTLLTEDRTGAVKSSHLALFERTIAKGYTLPMRDGIASHWQAGKHLFLAWYRKGPKPLIDVLSQAHGFGRLQGVRCRGTRGHCGPLSQPLTRTAEDVRAPLCDIPVRCIRMRGPSLRVGCQAAAQASAPPPLARGRATRRSHACAEARTGPQGLRPAR